MNQKAKVTLKHDDRVAHLTLASPKANILDREMMVALEQGANDLMNMEGGLRAVVIDAEGPNFSYGASIEEHLPDQIGEVLDEIHYLLGRLLDLPVPTIAAVRGQCLGGGFELVLACDLILAEEKAVFACPEIKLGVFPPAATALLPERIGSGPAAELLLTGTSWSAARAEVQGLVTRIAPAGELESSLENWLEEDFIPRSPTGFKHAVQAARRNRVRILTEELTALEQQYVDELMTEPEATEGITAFLEKRPPTWQSSRRKAGETE
jgi:cyclohexa-1,5-dienecarbonyl-CoA hydratase